MSTPGPWQAPLAGGPVTGLVRLPGSKSLTNRALLLAALATAPATLTGVLRSRDTDLMMDGLRALGVGIAVDADDPTTVIVTPGPLHGAAIDCGLAGTVMRFVPPAAALASGTVTFDGDPHARERPLAVILDALRALGIGVAGTALPFALTGEGTVAGGAVTIDASGSSQFVSGLLLSGARYDNGLTVHHVGKPVPSLPHIEMTVQMLRAAGVVVDTSIPNTWRVEPGPIAAVDWAIEPDLSNAAVFLAAAALTGGAVSVPRWPAHTTQPGAQIVDVLRDMGAEVEISGDVLTVRGTGALRPLTRDLADIGELTPTIAALTAFADGVSVLSGIAHLRGHETNRLAALTTEINRLGGDATETADGIRITPAPLHGGLWQAYADHRMATAGALVGLVVPDVQVDDIGSTSKTLPEFPELWAKLLG